jgi:hypothetical protein
MQQRYYDPGGGRFLSVDPVTANGNTGGNFNRYWYANDNPYRFTDPDGRCSETSCDAWGDYAGTNTEEVKPFRPLAVAVTAAMAVPLVAEIAPEAVQAAKNKTFRKIAKEVFCLVLAHGSCSGKELMDHVDNTRQEMQRKEDAERQAKALQEWLRRRGEEQPGPPPPKPKSPELGELNPPSDSPSGFKALLFTFQR